MIPRSPMPLELERHLTKLRHFRQLTEQRKKRAWTSRDKRAQRKIRRAQHETANR